MPVGKKQMTFRPKQLLTALSPKCYTG